MKLKVFVCSVEDSRLDDAVGIFKQIMGMFQRPQG
jgi:hypothetical protein